MNKVVGWYSAQSSVTPEHDPGFPVPCPYCTDEVLRETISEEAKPLTIFVVGEKHMYFYRAHTSCYRRAKPSIVDKIHDELIGDG